MVTVQLDRDTSITIPEKGELSAPAGIYSLLLKEQHLHAFTPHRATINGLEAVLLYEQGLTGYTMTSETLSMLWVPQREEWVGVYTLVKGANYEEETVGPFKLKVAHGKKILEAFGELRKFPAEQVVKTSPADLAQIVLPREIKDLLPDYLIWQKVGEGATRKVFLADFKFREKRVVKVLKKPEEIKERIRANLKEWLPSKEEVDTLLHLHHDGIVRLYDWDEQGKYTIEQYVEGETLQQRIRRQGQLGLEELWFFYDLLEALCYLHEQGLVHRDVKPSNIILTKRSIPGKETTLTRAVLTDFQTARRMSKHEELVLQRTPWTDYYYQEAYYGSPVESSYAAPELLTLNRASRASDIYSVTLLIAESISGEHFSVTRKELLDQSKYREAVTLYLDGCIEKALTWYEPDPRLDLVRQKLSTFLHDGLTYSPYYRQMRAYDILLQKKGIPPRFLSSIDPDNPQEELPPDLLLELIMVARGKLKRKGGNYSAL